MDADSPESVALDAAVRSRRRADLGRTPDAISIRVRCTCGRTLGRLVGRRDGTLLRFAGIEGAQREVEIGGRPTSYSRSTVYAVGQMTSDPSPVAPILAATQRYRARCPSSTHRRKVERTWRRDTLAQVFARAARAGRRDLEIDTDL